MTAAPRLTTELSPQRCRAYEQLAMAMVKRTVAQYTDHVQTTDTTKRSLDTKTWKLLKQREKIQIYKSRDKFQPNLFVDSCHSTPQSPSLIPAQWAPHAKLLCVGTLAGTLDDAMLGTVTPTELAMVTRSRIIHDEFVQHRVLQDIKVPSVDEPFEYVGLKWALRSSPLRSIMRARDLVYVEASGYQFVPIHGTHERIGYTLCHSLEIPELQPATTHDVVRAKFSMCSVYRQKSAGVVEVFVTLMSDPGGNVSPKLASLSAASALIAAARVMDCALERKLAWLLTSQYTAAVSPDGSCIAVAKAQGSHWCCLRCARSLSSFSSLSPCGVCHSTVCTKCLTTRKIVVGPTASSLSRKAFQVCTGCMGAAQRAIDTAKVAAEQFVDPMNARLQQQQFSTTAKVLDTELPSRTEFVTTSTDMTGSFVSSEHSRSPSPRYVDPVVLYVEPTKTNSHKTEDFYSTKPLELGDLEVPDEDERTEDEDDELVQDVEPLAPAEIERLRLLEQMQELRLQAEQTFRMTKRQTRTIQRSALAVDARQAFSKSALY